MGRAELVQFVIAGLKNGSIYALVALGFTVVHAATRVINFAQGEFYMLGGMLGYFAFSMLGLPLPAAAVTAVALTTLVGVVFELLAIRPKKDGDPLALVIITVGGSMLMKSLARHGFGGSELSLPAFSDGPSLHVLGASLDRQTIWVWALTASAVVLLWWVYTRTRFGLSIRACAENREAARLMGVNTGRVVTASFAIAAAMGALAGLVVTPLTQTAFDIGASIGLKGFAAAILGGLGSPLAAVMGGIVLGLVESLSIAFISSTYKDAIALVVLLLVLFIRPQGLFGGRSSREKV